MAGPPRGRRRGGRPLGDWRSRALRGACRLCKDSGVRELRERVRWPAQLRARCRLAMAVSSHHAAKMDASVLRCRSQSMCAAFRSTRWRATLSGETPAARREKASPANGPNSAVAQLVSAQNMDHWRLARPTYPAIHGASRLAAPYGRHGEATSSAIVIVNLPAVAALQQAQESAEIYQTYAPAAALALVPAPARVAAPAHHR